MAKSNIEGLSKMALTEQDRIECKEIAREIVRDVLYEHIQNCPHHQAYLINRARFIGMFLGVIAASGLSSGTVAAVLMNFLK